MDDCKFNNLQKIKFRYCHSAHDISKLSYLISDQNFPKIKDVHVFLQESNDIHQSPHFFEFIMKFSQLKTILNMRMSIQK